MCIENIEYFMIQYLEQENIPDFPDIEILFIENLMIFYFSKILVIIVFRIKRKSIVQSFICRMPGYVGLCHSLPLSIIFRKASLSRVPKGPSGQIISARKCYHWTG
jgi:hypothetical protein